MKTLNFPEAIIRGFILIFVLFTTNLTAQENNKSSLSEIVKLYNLSESNYSVNDEFINGCIYSLPNIKISGDPYYDSNQWYKGTLFINGKDYSNFFLKYDLILDEVIIKVKADENIERLIMVNKSQIDSFIIGSSRFINSGNLFPQDKKSTYFEKVSNGNLSVFKHYKKSFIDIYSNVSPYGKYSSQKSNTYLFDNQKLTNINKLKSFLKYFEKDKQEKIKKYLKTTNINYKKLSRSQLTDLMGYCTLLISN